MSGDTQLDRARGLTAYHSAVRHRRRLEEREAPVRAAGGGDAAGVQLLQRLADLGGTSMKDVASIRVQAGRIERLARGIEAHQQLPAVRARERQLHKETMS